MWVFSRKKNEQLVIYDDIVVTVIEIRGDKVRLGIQHPPGVTVSRHELIDAFRRLDSVPAAPPDTPLEPPPAKSPEPHLDTVAQLAAALQARLAVPVDRNVVVQAMRDAGMQ